MDIEQWLVDAIAAIIDPSLVGMIARRDDGMYTLPVRDGMMVFGASASDPNLWQVMLDNDLLYVGRDLAELIRCTRVPVHPRGYDTIAVAAQRIATG